MTEVNTKMIWKKDKDIYGRKDPKQLNYLSSKKEYNLFST